MIHTLEERVNKALDEISPYLIKDGGGISVVDFPDDHTVRIRLEGNCISCDFSQMTFQQAVVTTIKKYAPEIENVLDVSPHA